jgi:glycosyltransferase involved in cell wall biosynthesis
MRILYFTRGQSPHDLRFTQALATSGHSAAVLCLEDVGDKPWPQEIEVLRWPKSAPAKFSWFSAPALAGAFRKVVLDYRPDVVHAGPIQKTAFIAASAGVKPLVSMSWGSDLLMDAHKDAIWKCVTRYTLKRTTVLAADCQTVVNAARGFGYTGPARVFPWGVDLDHFKPGKPAGLRKQLGWEKNMVFLCNRTMEKLYGVDVVAEAFIQAAALAPNIRLMLFGKGSQETAIRMRFEQAGILDRVHFGGFAGLDDLPGVYNSTDFYVSASHSDGSSVTLMEALACGVPALLSDIPSNREWLGEGREGWYFKDGDAAALAQRMLEASKRADISKMSVAARKLAEKRADWKKNFSVLLSAYAEAAALHKKVTA